MSLSVLPRGRYNATSVSFFFPYIFFLITNLHLKAVMYRP